MKHSDAIPYTAGPRQAIANCDVPRWIVKRIAEAARSRNGNDEVGRGAGQNVGKDLSRSTR
jgi:hypothetical protein